MPNITKTSLYQACTKITNISSQDMCLNHVPRHVPNHQPIPSTMYHNKCINHAPSLYHTKYQSCTIPCANHVHQHHTMYQSYTISCHTPYTNKPRYDQQCISTSRPQPTCTMHPMMCLKSYTKAHKHMLQTCSLVSPRCNLITQYTKPQICTITYN
jgi:hypothetical protein